MQKHLASILRDQLLQLDFITKLGGLVYTQVQKQKNIDSDTGKEVSYSKKFPVSNDVRLKNTKKDISGKLIDFAPNSQGAGMVYFEALSDIREISRRGKYKRYSNTLRLVFWGNSNLLSKDLCLSENMERQVIKCIEKIKRQNMDGFIHLVPKVVGISGNKSIFDKYTYDEEVTQYLMPPFVYFAIDIEVSFFCTGCISPFTPKVSLC